MSQEAFSKIIGIISIQMDRADNIEKLLQLEVADLLTLISALKDKVTDLASQIESQGDRLAKLESDMQQVKWSLPKPDTMARAHSVESDYER